MSFDLLGDLNWLAVLVAALAYFAVGALWYAPPVFGKTWAAAGGPMLWGAVNAGYHVVGNLLAAIIVASWR